MFLPTRKKIIHKVGSILFEFNFNTVPKSIVGSTNLH